MSSNTGSRSAAPRKNRDQMMAGILIGMVIGVGLAAGIAWYMMKSPTPFVQKAPVADKTPAVSSPQNITGGAADSDASGKPRFEFYKVLTDKQDKSIVVPPKPADKARDSDRKPAIAYEPHLLQAGSFQNADDAEKLKAKLALLGVEANVQSANIPDKGVWYRVRLGPYKTSEEENRARSFLKQNGVDSTPIRAQ
ncbi:MAG: SPOR domain-containing protein [Pseudomonadota bacterium]